MAFNYKNFTTQTPHSSLVFGVVSDDTKFAAMKLFEPTLTETGQSAQSFYQSDSSDLRSVNVKSNSKSVAPTVDFGGGFKRTVEAEENKLRVAIDPRDVANTDKSIGNMFTYGGKKIGTHLLMSVEKQAITLSTTSTNYPTNAVQTLVDGSSTINSASGDFEAVCATARAAVRKNCGQLPNTLLMPFAVYDKYIRSANFKARTQGTGARVEDMTSEQKKRMIMSMAEVSELIIADAQEDIATGNATDLSDMWGDSLVFAVKNPSMDYKVVRYGNIWFPKVNGIWTKAYEQTDVNSAHGTMQYLEGGWEQVLAPGLVMSDVDNDFAAGALVVNAVV